ncbi:hypothetical protein ABBQ38_15524 [Trebouxia sp. C0009 RCD-2024]
MNTSCKRFHAVWHSLEIHAGALILPPYPNSKQAWDFVYRARLTSKLQARLCCTCQASRFSHHFIGFVKAQLPLAAITIAVAAAAMWNGSAPAVQITRTFHSTMTTAFCAHYQASLSQHGGAFQTCSHDELRR